MSPAVTITVAALAGVGFAALVMGATDAIRAALRPRRDWEFGNPAPCERVVRPTPTPRPPGLFGTQTFPIYPRPGDADYCTKVEWAPGSARCQCPLPAPDGWVRGPGFLLNSCTRCGLPISLSRPMPDTAFVDGYTGWSLIGWIMPVGGDPPDAEPRPVWRRP